MVWPFSSAAAPAPSASACPVDHETRQKWQEQTCPVDHETQAAYLEQAKAARAESGAQAADGQPLSLEREVSSIPRFYMEGADPVESEHTASEAVEERDNKWVYPSPNQFYNAVRRKNHDAKAEDMNVVVPIHNAVNEEAWRMIRDWESKWNTPDAPAPQLVNFVGRPRDFTWRAWMRNLAGYQLPFDRHDWVVVRPSDEENAPPKMMRYIIDFYAGRNQAASSSSDAMAKTADPKGRVSFYLDVRPAPDTVEGIAMRLHRWWLPTS